MNWRTPITLSVLVVILIGAAYYGWQSVVAPPDDSVDNTAQGTPTTPPTCKEVTEVRKEKRIDAEDVLVNVYNAGTIPGLATTTLAALEGEGFRAGVADNAPAGATATNVTILTSSRQSPAVRLLAQQFGGEVAYADAVADDRPGIDVVVGDAFQSVDVEADNFLVLRERAVSTTCKTKTTATP